MEKKHKAEKIYSRSALEKLLEDIPGVDADKVWMLLVHWRMMVQSEDNADLTRLTNADDIALKHYLDSALPLRFLKLPSPLLDIGSGAGFPGLVLKILSPETEVVLGEVRPKRTRFLQAVIDELKLTGVTVYPHRIGPQFPLEVQGVVTRALESARDTLYRVQPFLPAGGKVLLLKGPKGDEEIQQALEELTDFCHEKTFSYRLGNTQNKRQLLLFSRQRESIRSHSNMNAASKQSANPKLLQITSRANPLFKTLVGLNDARGISKEKKFLVSGAKLVDEILESKTLRQEIETVVAPDGYALPANVSKAVVLAPALFREVDTLGTKAPLALMKMPLVKAWQGDRGKGVTLFIPFQDPGNVGAAIRSAAAFGAERVVLLKEAASPFLPKAVRAAANALFAVELLSGPTMNDLVKMDREIYRLDASGDDIETVDFQTPVLLLTGAEGFGFRSVGRTRGLRIPISGAVESLNAQSALAIALYEISRKLQSVKKI